MAGGRWTLRRPRLATDDSSEYINTLAARVTILWVGFEDWFRFRGAVLLVGYGPRSVCITDGLTTRHKTWFRNATSKSNHQNWGFSFLRVADANKLDRIPGPVYHPVTLAAWGRKHLRWRVGRPRAPAGGDGRTHCDSVWGRNSLSLWTKYTDSLYDSPRFRDDLGAIVDWLRSRRMAQSKHKRAAIGIRYFPFASNEIFN